MKTGRSAGKPTARRHAHPTNGSAGDAGFGADGIGIPAGEGNGEDEVVVGAVAPGAVGVVGTPAGPLSRPGSRSTRNTLGFSLVREPADSARNASMTARRASGKGSSARRRMAARGPAWVSGGALFSSAGVE